MTCRVPWLCITALHKARADGAVDGNAERQAQIEAGYVFEGVCDECGKPLKEGNTTGLCYACLTRLIRNYKGNSNLNYNRRESENTKFV